jgi:hypothetical protein
LITVSDKHRGSPQRAFYRQRRSNVRLRYSKEVVYDQAEFGARVTRPDSRPVKHNGRVRTGRRHRGRRPGWRD